MDLLQKKAYDRRQLERILHEQFGAPFYGGLPSHKTIARLKRRGVKTKRIYDFVTRTQRRGKWLSFKVSPQTQVFYTDESQLEPYKNEWLEKNRDVLL